MKKYAFLIILAIILVACSQPTVAPTQTAIPATATTVPPSATPQPTLTPTVEATATQTLTPTLPAPTEPTGYGPDNFPTDVDPLTGLKVADPALLDRRPIAAKVNIVPRYSNRPPWGLSQADIVYDYYHNDGYTRFYAIFYGTDAPLVGPIRSGRLLDVDLTRMYQSILAYGSADARINDRLLNSEFSDRLILEGNAASCPPTPEKPMCRFEPTGVDLMLGSTQALSQHITNKGVSNGRQNLNGMVFNANPAPNGTPINQAFVRYSADNYLRWDYDAASGRFLRFQDNAFDQGQGEVYSPLIDRNNNQQIAAENVVIVYSRHEYVHRAPGEIIEILLSGTGSGYAMRDGQIYQVTWERQTLNSVLTLRLPDGTLYPFKPGNTWFQVVGVNTKSSQPSEGVWRFEFHIP